MSIRSCDRTDSTNHQDTLNSLWSALSGSLLCVEAAAETLFGVGNCFAETVAVEPGFDQYPYFTSWREPRGVYRVAVANLIDCEAKR